MLLITALSRHLKCANWCKPSLSPSIRKELDAEGTLGLVGTLLKLLTVRKPDAIVLDLFSYKFFSFLFKHQPCPVQQGDSNVDICESFLSVGQL